MTIDESNKKMKIIMHKLLCCVIKKMNLIKNLSMK